MKRMTSWTLALAAVAWMVPSVASAQQAGNPNDPWCRDGGDRDRGRYCEVREMTLPHTGGVLTVDAAPNGSIKIVGTSRADIFVRAKVQANADTDQQAQAIAKQISVQAAGSIHAQGPARDDDNNWSVSYEVSVPEDQALVLSSVNGSIALQNVRGGTDARTQNGSIALTDVAGTVKGRTQNGSVSVSLQGASWNGEGLDLQTTNGSVRLTVPDGFAAHLETSTRNGRVSVDFPITGEIDRRHVTADLNGGGAPVKVTTVNGSVSIKRRTE